MKDKFIKAVDKISSHLLEISDDEFTKIIEKHKDGKYANILKDMSYCFSEDVYDFTANKYISIEFTKMDFQLSFDFFYNNESKTIDKINLEYNTVKDNPWVPLAA